MRTSPFSPEQIIRALREAEAGRPVGELCRQLNVAEATFYRWKKQVPAYEKRVHIAYTPWRPALRRGGAW